MELVASYPQHNKKIANRKHVAPPHLWLKATYNCKTGFFGQIFVTLLKCRKMNGVHELEERAALRRVISHLFVYTTVIITYGSVQKSQQVVFRMLTLMAFL